MSLAELLYSAMLSTSSPMAAGSQLGGRVHQFAAPNEQLEQGLAAGVLAALKGNDGLILAAYTSFQLVIFPA